MKEKIVVAMSGGVDSSVSAALLKQQGYEVEGVFMKNWSPETLQGISDCPWQQDQDDAAAVCDVLGIPFRSVNFEQEYRDKVLDYFLREYQAGRTPNPDVMCNKEIKFRLFLDYAKSRGATRMATGHYAQVAFLDGVPVLCRGKDGGKDQSYFLWNLSREQLASAVFPVGGMEKREVRQRAQEFNLPNAKKKDSQGICFIGHLDVKRFLQDNLQGHTGEVKLLPAYEDGVSWQDRKQMAKTVGAHKGLAYYTVGERAGALVDNALYRRVTGKTQVPPIFVVDKELDSNTFFVTDSTVDAALYANKVCLDEMQFNPALFDEGNMTTVDNTRGALLAQVRYQQEAVEVADIYHDKNRVIVELSDPVKAAAKGQSCVIYQGVRVVGGGIICDIPK